MHPIVQQAAHKLRRHALEVWESRGGGFYGFVAMITFLWLEGVNLFGDVSGLGQMRLDVGGLISWLVQNAIQGLLTALWAAIWPVAWINHLGVGATSLALLAAAYLGYKAIHPMVSRLLREEEGGK
jgi:hypothetical protein